MFLMSNKRVLNHCNIIIKSIQSFLLLIMMMMMMVLDEAITFFITFLVILKLFHMKILLPLGFREGVIQALIATDVAARGLDIDNVDLII